MRLLFPLLASALLLPACAADGSKFAEQADDGAGGTDDTGEGVGDSGDSATDTGYAPEPAWYTVRATLAVVEGVASLDGAAVDLIVVAKDRTTTVCEVPLELDSLAVGTAPDPAVPLWWELEVEPAIAPCSTLPAALGLGIGELAADVRAQLGRDELDDVADSLFGAYLRVDAGALSTFGWAATDTGMDGASTAVLPPADGVYQLEPVYLLPLP